MPLPSVDIIVPVWNNPFETRACLAAILTHSPEARLIIVDNGSSRETELMLEEFSESLGDKALFMTAERNIGLIPAINRGLASSDSDFALIVRPNVMVCSNWLKTMLGGAANQQVGIISPTFSGNGAPVMSLPLSGCSMQETFSLSFTSLLLRGSMHRSIGGFDENMDGGEWCLKDYIRRAESKGYNTCVTTNPKLVCSKETVFGSQERRMEQARLSRDCYLSRWGIAKHYCLYFGKVPQAGDLSESVETVLAGARQGNRFTLLLHRKQFKEFKKRGWDALHTGITTLPLPMFGAVRSLSRKLVALQATDPDMIRVRGSEGALFPDNDVAISFNEIATYNANHLENSLEGV